MKHCVDSTLLVSGTGLSLLRISLGLKTDRIENANQRVRCQICHSKKSTINLVNQIRNKLNSLTDKSSGIPGNVIQKRHLFKTRKRKAPQAREKMRFWCKHSTNMVFESAAGAPKNQVFLDQVSCRTPPRGGGVSADLNHLSKITGFLNHLTPMNGVLPNYIYRTLFCEEWGTELWFFSQ